MKLSYPLRLDEELMNKLKTLSEMNSRSINKQLEYIIKNYIADYEKNNSPLEVKE